MKSKLINLGKVAVVSVLVQSVFAVQEPADKKTQADRIGRAYEPSFATRLEQLGKVSKAGEVIGMEVKNLQNEKIGKVEDLGIDLKAGRIVQVIVSSGGVFGLGDKTLAVPSHSFSRDPVSKVLRLDMDKEALKSAPTFDMSQWNECFEAERVVEVYRYYRQDPYFVATYQAKVVPNSESASLGYVEKASKFIGMYVKNRQDEKLGKVDNLMVDIENGRVAQVLVSTGGFLGIGDELSVVPPSAFHYDHAQGILHLDTSKDALTKAPHLKSSEWPNLSDPRYSGEVYRAYRVEPYFRTDADNTARNVRDRSDTLTPLDQGSSAADLEVTRRIRKEIQSQKDLSVNARNIKVITVNGRVTLRGPVNSSEERRLLANIAGRIAEAANVENQLEVKAERRND